jgi:ankyrin repeat protein
MENQNNETTTPADPAANYRLAAPDIMRAFCQMAAEVGILDLNQGLLKACEDGHPDLVRALIEAGADVHVPQRHIDMTVEGPIRNAVEGGNPEVVKILVAAGADVHTGGDLPVRLAASKGHARAVKALIEAGADFHRANPWTAIDSAILKGRRDAAQVLFDAGARASREVLKYASGWKSFGGDKRSP